MKKHLFGLIIIVVGVAVGIAYGWSRVSGPREGAKDLFAGFSKLVVSPAYAEDNFTLTASAEDSLGVQGDSVYVLKSKEAVSTALIKENLVVEPDISYRLKEVSATEWQVMPEQPLPPNTLLRVALATSYTDDAGVQRERDYSWAFQVKDSLKVLHSIPRHAATEVPLDTGIEVTFSHDTVKNFEQFFSIEPKVDGQFEQHGRTFVFVPKNPLAKGTLYTVTVRAGLPVSNSEETLSASYSFTFETTSDRYFYDDPAWFNVYKRFYELHTEETPLIQLSARNVQNVAVRIYAFSDWQGYMEALKERDRLPWWSYTKEAYRADTSALRQVASFTQTIKEQSDTGLQYVEFPERLPAGFYVVELSAQNEVHQVWLQVSDLLTYVNFTNTDSIVWVNDVKTKNPVSGATIEIAGTPYQYRTNEQGVARFETPKDMVEAARDLEEETRYYLKISHGRNTLVLPASPVLRSFAWGWENQADDYWQYLYTDRPRYQPTDVIKFWGLVKDRGGKPMKEKVTITLNKEGYVDYYYRPVRVIEQEIALSAAGTFVGEMKIENVRPDYYTLEIRVGDEVIKTKSISIRPYTKPAYELTLVPDKTIAYADETIRLKGKASFFEGTPVPNLDLVFTTSKGEERIKTNGRGEVDITYTRSYHACTNDYQCWPEYAYLSLRPADSELAEIVADTNVQFYGPSVYLNQEVAYPEKGVAEVTLTTKQVDLERLIGDAWWVTPKDDRLAPATKIEGKVVKTTYVKREIGTGYDFINKKSYPQYVFDRRDETLETFSVTTDNQGVYTYRRPVEPETSYQLYLKVFDDKGRSDNYVVYLYYYDGASIAQYNAATYSYHHLDFADPDAMPFSIGERVALRFMRDQDELPVDNTSYLYLQMQNGLRQHSVLDTPTYQFTFGETDIPNVWLEAVYFTGTAYVRANANAVFDATERGLKIDVESDKVQYLPGEDVTLRVRVTDKNDRPAAAEVNLNLIDEAFYAVAGDTADPLGALYQPIGSGSLFSLVSHEPVTDMFGGAEKGGCFTGETMILMADGSEKPIKDIRVGDAIRTFVDPLTREFDQGIVTEVFRHTVNEYYVINGTLEVTPVHVVYASGRFQQVKDLAPGDWLLTSQGEKVTIRTIEKVEKIVPVYNFRVDPEHTYFAGGFYVHNDKGGGPREFFTDAALFTSIKTDAGGRGSVTFKLPDNITSWRVTAQAVGNDISAGDRTIKIPVSLPVFAEVTIGDEYLLADKPVARLRAFGTALSERDQVRFTLSTPSLGLDMSEPKGGVAFGSLYMPLPALKLGTHDITYALETEKGNDSIKLPVRVADSRLQAEVAKSGVLSTETVITPENNLPVTVVLSDIGQNTLYGPLENLRWAWGDRVDQVVARHEAEELLSSYYQEEVLSSAFDVSAYQAASGGITLLPYSSEDLELSARIAALGAPGFDKESLAQYLLARLEDRVSTPDEVTWSLSGLAWLNQPVLPRIQAWIGKDDLSVANRLYMAQALFALGDTERSRDLYTKVIKEFGEKRDPYIIVRASGNPDETFRATALAAVLAGALQTTERDGLWAYLLDYQRLWGPEKNSETLFVLEQSQYIKYTLPTLKPSPARVVYTFLGETYDIPLTGGKTHAFAVDPTHANSVKFERIDGAVGISVRSTQPLAKASGLSSGDMQVHREYYVGGKRTNIFRETDVVEVRLYPRFGAKAIPGDYQLTDVLPSGLLPVTTRITGYYDQCGYWYPYDTEGQLVKFRIPRYFSSNCGTMIRYVARVKTRGEYKAEPAILQSFVNPAYINFSGDETITITE